MAAVHLGTGRRKRSTARVRLTPGKGTLTINGRAFEDFFRRETARLVVCQPLVACDMLSQVDITAHVSGGGNTGQAGALRLGIARALMQLNKEFHPVLRQAGYLTRDARKVERKKVGLRKARKDVQFSKR